MVSHDYSMRICESQLYIRNNLLKFLVSWIVSGEDAETAVFVGSGTHFESSLSGSISSTAKYCYNLAVSLYLSDGF